MVYREITKTKPICANDMSPESKYLGKEENSFQGNAMYQRAVRRERKL